MGPLILEHKTNEAGGLDLLLFDLLVSLPQYSCDPAFQEQVPLPKDFSNDIARVATSLCDGFNKQLIITSCPPHIVLRQYSGHPVPEWVFENYDLYATHIHNMCEREIKEIFYGQEERKLA